MVKVSTISSSRHIRDSLEAVQCHTRPYPRTTIGRVVAHRDHEPDKARRATPVRQPSPCAILRLNSLQEPKHLVEPPPRRPHAKRGQTTQQRIRRNPIHVLLALQHPQLPRPAVLVRPHRHMQRRAQPEQTPGPAMRPVELFVAEAQQEAERVILRREKDDGDQLRECEKARPVSIVAEVGALQRAYEDAGGVRHDNDDLARREANVPLATAVGELCPAFPRESGEEGGREGECRDRKGPAECCLGARGEEDGESGVRRVPAWRGGRDRHVFELLRSGATLFPLFVCACQRLAFLGVDVRSIDPLIDQVSLAPVSVPE